LKLEDVDELASASVEAASAAVVCRASSSSSNLTSSRLAARPRIGLAKIDLGGATGTGMSLLPELEAALDDGPASTSALTPDTSDPRLSPAKSPLLPLTPAFVCSSSLNCTSSGSSPGIGSVLSGFGGGPAFLNPYWKRLSCDSLAEVVDKGLFPVDKEGPRERGGGGSVG
jgi:hypothetical protein